MTRKERVRYEMLLRVGEFAVAHRELFPETSAGGKTFAKVVEATDAAAVHMTSKMKGAQEGREARTAARKAVREAMHAIVRTARDIARTAPGEDHRFQMPARKSDVALLAGARTVLDDVRSVQDRFVTLGLPASFVDDLAQKVAAFEAAVRGRLAGRSKVAASQAGIKAALAQGMSAVLTLDVIVANTAGVDPVVMAAWRRDRRVIEGDPKHAPTVTVATPDTAEVAPAAQAAKETPADPLRRAS